MESIDYLVKVRGLLIKTEVELRQLLAEAATVGDYDAVMTLTEMAKAVQHIEPNHTKITERRSAVKRLSKADELLSFDDQLAETQFRPRPDSSLSDDDPKFLREGDDLVRIGLSPVTGEPRRYRVDRAAVEAVARRIDEIGEERFDADALGRIHRVDYTAVPADHIHTVVSWFRNYGLISRQGAEGYTREGPTPIADQIGTTWELLPES